MSALLVIMVINFNFSLLNYLVKYVTSGIAQDITQTNTSMTTKLKKENANNVKPVNSIERTKLHSTLFLILTIAWKIIKTIAINIGHQKMMDFINMTPPLFNLLFSDIE